MLNFITYFAAGCSKPTFLGLKPWYFYLPMSNNNGVCEPTNFDPLSKSGIPLILLAIIDDLLIIAGMVAVFFTIYAGIKFITSQGSPDEAAKARHTLINAIIGLAIALLAIGTVSFIGSQLGSSSGATGVAGLPNSSPNANDHVIANVLKIVFGIIGALSFLFVVIGGFKYIVAQGEPQRIAQAKNTIMYALIGVVVAILAQAIIGFVVERLS